MKTDERKIKAGKDKSQWLVSKFDILSTFGSKLDNNRNSYKCDTLDFGTSEEIKNSQCYTEDPKGTNQIACKLEFLAAKQSPDYWNSLR